MSAYQSAPDAGTRGFVSVAVAALLVGAYLLIAPVMISQALEHVESPSTRDQFQAVLERCRSKDEWSERALNRLAESVGLDWFISAFGRICSLVQQGRDREAAELYRQEAGATEAEADEAIKNWDSARSEIKLGLLVRHLQRVAGRDARP